ncbi:SelT/SelW/SelH family protein [Halorubellus sp. JP-L1]|uniref:SelT/SelW/SelH family protein n=1 Tax=Halorubellus sp. JP-L1 TaxID=2715753 RepID=UPI001409EE14|nr:Rdx family protein [Halorubellus sp. JP-L1]NHN40081.1 SelT/SelW/SelH family protein [Halorubellus sp. JP-L1]
MTTVEIEFCLPCGYLNRAEDVQHVLVQSFGETIDEVTLVPGDDGVFTVTANGTTVFDIADDDYDVDEIVRDVRQHA